MAWGTSGSLQSCDSLLKRVEENDNKLVDLIILPMKTFGDAEANRLSNAIANGSNIFLQSISASGHYLTPESLRRLGLALSIQAKSLKESSSVHSDNRFSWGISNLAIGSNNMGDEGTIALCQGLAESNGGLIKYLDVAWKNIGTDGLIALGATFASSPHLRYLDLSRNDNIGCQEMRSFCSAAKESVEKDIGIAFATLEQLILTNCKIGSSGVQSLSEIILDRVKFNTLNRYLQRLDLFLDCNSVGVEGCFSIASLCAGTINGSVLSKLHLSQCSIGDEGISILSKAAMSNPCIGLTFLDVSKNSISEVGARILSESLLNSWPSLVELNLASNNLGGEGVVMVVNSLLPRLEYMDHSMPDNKNITLKILDLSDTNCEIKGASSALMSGGLKSLRLFNNKLGSEGFLLLSKLLIGGHSSIEHLDLGGNSANEESVITILAAVAKMNETAALPSKLCTLEMGGNEFGMMAAQELQSLKMNRPHIDVAHDKPVLNTEEVSDAS